MYRILYGLALLGLVSTCLATNGTHPVPEVDGSGALAAIAVFGGVVSLIAERRRK